MQSHYQWQYLCQWHTIINCFNIVLILFVFSFDNHDNSLLACFSDIFISICFLFPLSFSALPESSITIRQLWRFAWYNVSWRLFGQCWYENSWRIDFCYFHVCIMVWNPFAADNTLMCGWKFEHIKLRSIESNASELLKILKKCVMNVMSLSSRSTVSKELSISVI